MGNDISKICSQIQDGECKIQTNKSFQRLTNGEKSTTHRVSKIFVNDQNQNSFTNKTLIYTQYHSKINFRQPDDFSDSIVIHPLKSRQENCEPRTQQIITPSRVDIEYDKEIEYLWQQATEKNHNQMGQSERKIYEIEFLQDSKKGFGRILDIQGFLLYEGEFYHKQKQGNGTLYFQKKDEIDLITLDTIQFNLNQKLFLTYSGEFKQDRFNGKGVLELQDGSYIYGTFIDDKPEGICTYESLQQNLCIQMIWKKGKFKRFVKTDKRYNCVRN